MLHVTCVYRIINTVSVPCVTLCLIPGAFYSISLCLSDSDPWHKPIYWLFLPFPYTMFLPVIFCFILTPSCCHQSCGLVLRESTSPPIMSSTLLRAALQHSLQWMRSLLSPLFLLFPLFPPQQDRKTEEIQQERRRERENRQRRAERDVRISQILLLYNLANSHFKREMQDPNKRF